MRALRPVAALLCLLAAGQAAASYRLRAGDTLSGVAARHHVAVADLAAANGVRDPNRVYAGTVLRIPDPPAPPKARAKGKLPLGLAMRPDRLALRPTFERWARAYGVPADLIEALAWYESGWQNGIVSPTGAVGIGQLMPDTTAFVTRQLLHLPLDPKRPEDNIRMSTRFLRFLLDQTGGKADQAVAAYYQGLAAVRRGRIFAETKRYVDGILAFRPSFS